MILLISDHCLSIYLSDLLFVSRANETLSIWSIILKELDLFHIVCAHAYIGHVARYFSIIGETSQRGGKRILSH